MNDEDRTDLLVATAVIILFLAFVALDLYLITRAVTP
jgi:hypothetical protein